MKMISLRRQELILIVLPAAVHLNLYIFSVRLTTAITALCEGHSACCVWICPKSKLKRLKLNPTGCSKCLLVNQGGKGC